MRTSSVEDTAEWIITLALKIERGFAEKKLPWFIRWESIPTSAPSLAPTVPTPSQQPQITHNPSSPSTEEEEIVDLQQSPQPQPHSQTEAPILSVSHVEREPDKAYCSVVKRIKSANLTPENIGEIFLCQIPTVGPETATVIMQKYQHSLPLLIHALETEGPQCIDTLTTLDNKGHARKISKACVTNLQKYLLGNK